MRFRFTLSNNIKGDFVLPVNPDGWRDMNTLFTRSPKYHGVFYQQTISLKFFCGSGKEYIDEVLDDLGIDAVVTILIESSCSCINDDCDYEIEYSGKLDLKTWSLLNNKASVNIIQESIADTVINRLDVAIDLTKLETLDGTILTDFTYGPYTIDMHSKSIVEVSKLSAVSQIQVDTTTTVADAQSGLVFPIPLEVELSELATISAYTNIYGVAPISASNPDSLFTAGVSGSYVFAYDFSGMFNETLDRARTYQLVVAYRVNDAATLITDYGLTSYPAGTGIHNIAESGTVTLSLSSGDTFSIYASISSYSTSAGSDPLWEWTLNAGSFIKVSSITTGPSTTAKVYGKFEAGARISQAITNQIDAFRSTLYGRKNSEPFAYNSNGCASFRAVTSGALIRNFPITDRPPRITMNDFFDSCNAIDNIGMGIVDDKIVFEKKDFFYSNTMLFQLSNVPDIKTDIAKEYYYSRVNIGYEKWQIEQVNGLDEVNSKRQYDLGLKTIDNPLDVISPMIAGAYPIEAARRKQYFDSFTEDTDTDNDNFIICLNKSVDGLGVPNNLTTAEKDENFISVNNTLDPPTSYNLDISPGRNFLRWSPVVNVGLLKYPARNIKFTYGEGNFHMTSQTSASDCPGRWNNELFGESQDIQWDDANNSDSTPLWEPLIDTFKFPLTKAQADIIKNNPYGYIEFSSTSSEYIKGFILEAKRSLVGGMTEFKLLRKWQ